MSTRRITLKLLLSLLAVFFTQTVFAFFDPPWITPTNPTAGDTVSVNIHGGICDGIIGAQGYPQITQEGNAIRIVWYGQHWPEGSSDLLCSFGVGTLTYPFGTFPPGNYTLTVDLAYRDFSGVPSIFTIGVVPFAVAGTPTAAEPVPTLNPAGLLALALTLGLAAWTWRTHCSILFHIRRSRHDDLP